MADDIIFAPWTTDQVDALNAYQQQEDMHPYVCGTHACRAVLTARDDGWHCPKCDYQQTWAHTFIHPVLRAAAPEPPVTREDGR